MNYYNHAEFAKLLCITHSTFCDKIVKGYVPTHCKKVKSKCGIDGRVWEEPKVQEFMKKLIEDCEELDGEGYFIKNKSAFGFARQNIRAMLRVKKTTISREFDGYQLTINTLANIGI